jgi:hypothetical protein
MIRIALPLLLAVLACRTQPQARPSGYLGGYDEFVRDPESGALRYVVPDLDLSPYRRVIIDPVVVLLDAEAASQPVNPKELVALADYLRQALILAVRDAYPVVEEPAPDVLRLRVAITDVVPTKPKRNAAGTLVLPVRAVSAANKAITGTHLYVGEVAIEAELLDSVSGRRLIAVVDRKAGGKRLKGGNTSWGHVAKAFREWAVAFRLRLDVEQARARARARETEQRAP